MNVSEQLLQILTEEGVTNIFGLAGDALNPLVSALDNQDRVKWIKVKHEGNASYAAFAQGELSSNLGVCASTVGPGALHLINGLYNAKKERSPVLAITGQIPLKHVGTNFFQEVNLAKVFDDICEYQALVRTPEEAPRVMLKAMRIAINHRCVCRIELPADVAEMPAKNSHMLHKIFRSNSLVHPPAEEIEEATAMINDAKKIGILAGAGCRNAKGEVLSFAQKIKAPITHTVRSADIFDHSSENVVGLSGLIGNPSGYKAIMDCDLLIMLGTDFPYTDFLPKDTKTIQVDTRPENIGNRTSVTLGIHADIKAVIPEFISQCYDRSDRSFLDKLRTEFLKWKSENDEKADPNKKTDIMHPQAYAKAISDIASDDAIFVIDTGTAAIWSTNYMNFHSDRRVIGSFNHGSMAVGFPAAMGAQLLFPEREVWALVGDGAFHMSLQDFSTAVEYNLPLKIVVLNNEELGFVKIEMEEAGLAPNYDALSVKNFDFCAFAKICGGDGVKVTKMNEVTDAIEMAKNSDKPFIINAVVDSGELSLPPKIGFDEAKGFAVSKVKEVIKALNGDKRQWENIKKELNAYFD